MSHFLVSRKIPFLHSIYSRKFNFEKITRLSSLPSYHLPRRQIQLQQQQRCDKLDSSHRDSGSYFPLNSTLDNLNCNGPWNGFEVQLLLASSLGISGATKMLDGIAFRCYDTEWLILLLMYCRDDGNALLC